MYSASLVRRGWKTRALFTAAIVLSASIVSLLGFVSLFAKTATFDSASLISGVVVDKDGPVTGVSVRVRATDLQAFTDETGTFIIEGITTQQPLTLVAWRKNYFFGFVEATPGQSDPIQITIKRHHRSDSSEYEWEPSENCGECHTAYDEWLHDAHAQSARNQRFLTVFQGTDIHGNRSPYTDYGSGFPKTVDLTQPYFGPGFKLDLPNREGNCAACHTPQASNLPTTNTCGWSGCHDGVTAERSDELEPGISPLGLKGTAVESISCDFCHKIAKVRVDEETQLPSHDKPGIMSLSIYRPEPGGKFFMGSIDDAARDADSYNPIYEEGVYCASCHYGVFSNTVIYNSYGEWLESPYSDSESGQTCQDCHMPVAEQYNRAMASMLKVLQELDARNSEPLSPVLAAIKASAEKNYFVFPDKDGVYRPPEQVHTHRMPGASDKHLLQNAVTMIATTQIEEGVLRVAVEITNDKTGHHVPTGNPMRQMLLVISATDEAGNKLVLQDGSELPEWAGDYGGEPGKGFAKILQDALTDEAPTIAHWRLVNIASDTRIPALATDRTEYAFTPPTEGKTTVEVRLLYRRAFQQIMEWKGWDDQDILMAQASLVVE